MENKNSIEIWYDDQPDEVVDKVASVLLNFGLKINYLDGGDGYNTYEISKIDEE